MAEKGSIRYINSLYTHRYDVGDQFDHILDGEKCRCEVIKIHDNFHMEVIVL